MSASQGIKFVNLRWRLEDLMCSVHHILCMPDGDVCHGWNFGNTAGVPKVLGGLLRRGLQTTIRASNQGPLRAFSSFVGLFLTALNKTFPYGASLPLEFGAFGLTFFRTALDKSFVDLFRFSLCSRYGASLQDYRGLHSKRALETLWSQNVHCGPKLFCWGPNLQTKLQHTKLHP